MAVAQLDGLRLHYAASGPPDGPVLLLAHSLGTHLGLWEPQLPALETRFRVLRYDARGHGQSGETPGPYTIELLAGDVLRLLDALGVRRAHFCGLSIGGLVGMWLGAHAPDRVGRLALCNTAPRIGTVERWNARIESVRRAGSTRAVAGELSERWFTAAFRERDPSSVARAVAMLQSTSAEGYVASCAALRDADLGPALGAIRAETLVIAGSHDLATTAADGRALSAAIPGARHRELPAAHLSNLEAPQPFNAELLAFLTA